MAGGEGTRLRPLTSSRPKPLAPIANKPVMHHIVDLLRKHGFTQIIATLHYLADEIESYFGDGSDLGVSMSYVVEDTPLGTAGAVKLAQDLIGTETFVVISGDALTDLDITAALAYHRKRGGIATIVLQRVENPLEFGVVILDEVGRITRFLEKPSWSEVFSDTINTGIYILEPEILDFLDVRKIADFSKDLFPRMLLENRPMYGYVTQDYWSDIGNLQQYRQANYDLLQGRVHLDIPGQSRGHAIWAGENCDIHPEAIINGPVAIGKNVVIEAGAIIEESTVIGDSSIVSSGARLHRAVVWSDVFFGKNARATECTICDRNIIKDHATIGDGAVIGRNCTIGPGANVHPQVKIWPDKAVAAGGIVSMSLIYGIKWPGSLFGADGVSGLANIEITPEFAMKLGQAFGSFLRPGQKVVTGRDTHHATRIMNRCIISGLASVGVNVDDLRSIPIPLSRYSTRVGADAGVHVRVSPSDPNSFLIEFFDADGINIDKNVERKIESVFFREDFRRTGMDDVGLLDFPSRSLERYASGFLDALAPQALEQAKFRVVIDYAYGNASVVLPRLLSNLGIEMVALNAYFDDTKVRSFDIERERYLKQMATIVTTLQANLGILVDHGTETLAIVDDRGRIIGTNRLLALVTLLVSRAYPGARIALPVTAPRAIERIAQEHFASVVWTRADRRGMMALAATQATELNLAGGSTQGLIFPEFHPGFDALYATAKIMELLAREARPLSELVDMLPPWFMSRKIVPCPWERKGQIMRALFAEHQHEPIEMTDGLRISKNGGWVLVLPDASDPIFNVYAEGNSDSEAELYAAEIAGRIEELARA